MSLIGLKYQKGFLYSFIGLAIVYTYSLVALLDFWPPISPSLPTVEIVKLYARDNIQFRVGIVLMVLSGAFYLPLSIVISAQMARLEQGFPVLSTMQLCTGILGTWAFAFPPFVWGVAAFTVERPEAITVMLHEFGWLNLIAPATYFPLQVIPIILISMMPSAVPHSAFPRWIGYLTILMGFSGTAAVMAMIFRTGPFAWNGLISFYIPVIAFFIWLNSLLYSMLNAINRQAAAFQPDQIPGG